MKKIAAFVIMMIMTLTFAQAESIFPTLTNETQASETAISFGAVTGMSPASTMPLIDGGVQEIYTGVTVDQYNEFGSAMGADGYSLIAQNALEGGVELTVSDGNVTLIVGYTTADGILSVTYPAGIAPEKAMPAIFNGCEVVYPGSTISVPGYGSFTIGEMVLNGNSPIGYYDGWSYYARNLVSDVHLTGIFTNTGVDSVYIHNTMDITLYYITDENTYTYPMYCGARLDDDGSVFIGRKSSYGGIDFDLTNASNYPFDLDAPEIGSLESENVVYMFSGIPDAVKNSTTGIIAVVIEMNGSDTPYVLYVRI